jgi:hypothetical protein
MLEPVTVTCSIADAVFATHFNGGKGDGDASSEGNESDGGGSGADTLPGSHTTTQQPWHMYGTSTLNQEPMVRAGKLLPIKDEPSDPALLISSYSLAMASFVAFYAYACSSTLWKSISLPLGGPRPTFINEQGVEEVMPGSGNGSGYGNGSASANDVVDERVAYKLSMYLAAAVPLRFGLGGRRSLLATISTTDRLQAVAAAFKSHPPVLRSQVVECELCERFRAGRIVQVTPASLSSLCVDAIVTDLDNNAQRAVTLVDAPPYIAQAVVDRACHLQQLTRTRLETAIAPAST